MNQSLHLNRTPAPEDRAAAAVPVIPTVEHYRLVMGQFVDDEAKLEEYYQ